MSKRGLSVSFISLGCAKNLVDSEHMASRLLEAGIRLATLPEEADVLVVNTCAFIRDAQNESIDAILDACTVKASADTPCRAVVVTGCLPQRYRGGLRESLPEVDAFLGVDELDCLPETVRAAAAGRAGGGLTVSDVPGRVIDALPDRVLLTGGAHAYVKIAEGCNHRCSFCAIPGIRGRYRSRSAASICREAENLLERGVRELVLVAQDTTEYGLDLRAGASLAGLLRDIGRIGGDFRVRMLYGYPTRITKELLDAMGGTAQVCRYLDVPVQHAHPEVLRAMRRGTTTRAVLALPACVRRVLPDAALRTTCLVGFPGETDEQFEALLAYVKEARFDHLGVFLYSREEGTEAAGYAGRVPARVARQRRRMLLEAQQEIVREHARERIGGIERVLAEDWVPGRREMRGRSFREAPEVDGVVRVKGLREGQRGSFVEVRIVGARGYDLEGRAVGGELVSRRGDAARRSHRCHG